MLACVCVFISVCKIPSISLALNTLTSSMEESNKFTAGDECRTGFKTATLENNFAHLVSLHRYAVKTGGLTGRSSISRIIALSGTLYSSNLNNTLNQNSL